MARQARERSKSGNYFISLRGEELFATKADKERFLEIAGEKFQGGKVYGIEMGKKEIRMVVKENEKGISMIMKSLQTVYARYFNNANQREGKLFLGRFVSIPLESKKEVEEYVGNLKASKPKKTTEKKAPVKKTQPAVKTKKAEKKIEKKTVKKTEKPKTTEVAEETPKPKKKKNLPSWLL